MPAKMTIEKLLRKYFSKEVANALLAKIDEMIEGKRNAAEIESAIMASISTQIENEILTLAISKTAPITPVKAKSIQTGIGSRIRPIAVSPKIGPLVEVRVGALVAVRAKS